VAEPVFNLKQSGSIIYVINHIFFFSSREGEAELIEGPNIIRLGPRYFTYACVHV